MDIPPIHITFDDDQVKEACVAAGITLDDSQCVSCGLQLTTASLGHILPRSGEYVTYCIEPSCLNDYLVGLV